MKKTELKLYPCYCGGEMKIEKVSQNGGMDGTYWDWKLVCSKCGLTKIYAADSFYGRKYKTFEEVINDWNREKEKNIKTDVLDKIKAEIEALTDGAQPERIWNVDVLAIIDKYKTESEETE